LIKIHGTGKHEPHIGHTGRGPTANILVKRGGVIKHIAHIGHIGCVPSGYIRIETN
jgi:hypothetical protein